MCLKAFFWVEKLHKMTKAIILIFDGQSFLALHRLTQNRVSVPFPSVHVHRIALQSTAGPQRGAAAFWKTADPHVFYGNFWIFFILNKLHILYPNPNPAPTQHRKLPAFSHFQKKKTYHLVWFVDCFPYGHQKTSHNVRNTWTTHSLTHTFAPCLETPDNSTN